MVKGRHRKPDRTALPAGAQAMTGKGRNRQKAATYARPLPVRVLGAEKRRTPAKKKEGWSQFFWRMAGYAPPKEESKGRGEIDEVVTGRWDPLSRSVQLEVSIPIQGGAAGQKPRQEQSKAMRLLWECGFFGKGTLSRSEPTWRVRQVNTLRIVRERERGGKKIFTPEELTAMRRKERKAAKIERARLAIRAGQQLPDGITALGGTLTEEDEQEIERQVEQEMKQEAGEGAYGKHIPGLIYLKPAAAESKQEGAPIAVPADGSTSMPQKRPDEDGEDDYIDIEDVERLQLSSYETLFLAGMIGVLQVADENDKIIPLPDLYALLLSSSLPSTILPTSPLSRPSAELVSSLSRHWARPDNPFLIRYVAYHHYRSLGWVVRSGLKFCVDLLLYKKGPAFSHAEFGVVVIPVYEDEGDSTQIKQREEVEAATSITAPFGPREAETDRDWVWFSSTNRVQSQVLKTLVLCHVSVPSTKRVGEDQLKRPEAFVESLQSGQSFSVRETAIRRWVPARMRP